MLLLAIIYIIHLMGFINDLETPKIFGRSLYGMIGTIWGVLGFLVLISYDAIRDAIN